MQALGMIQQQFQIILQMLFCSKSLYTVGKKKNHASVSNNKVILKILKFFPERNLRIKLCGILPACFYCTSRKEVEGWQKVGS